jgi:tRNA pseudouridine32 synthase/23S rRNA pseudouridine746 synthase
MVIAYDSKAAGRLSQLFLKNEITKTYLALVKGELIPKNRGTIDHSLDGKKAITHFEVLEVKDGKSLLSLTIDTGRLHQIRRHLEIIGHPVMGDPKYGQGNKNRDGLKLLAKSLSFRDPWSQELRIFSISRTLTF